MTDLFTFDGSFMFTSAKRMKICMAIRLKHPFLYKSFRCHFFCMQSIRIIKKEKPSIIRGIEPKPCMESSSLMFAIFSSNMSRIYILYVVMRDIPEQINRAGKYKKRFEYPKLGLFIAVRVLGLVLKPAVRDIYSASAGMDPVIVVLEIRKRYLLSLKVLRWIEDLFYLFWRPHTKFLYKDLSCLILAHNECQCAGADVIPSHNGSGRTFIKAHLNGAYDCVVVLHGHASFRNHFLTTKETITRFLIS